jgi:mRNA interferase MazF
MQKDFDKWNNKKKNIDMHQERDVLFKVGEIWWCSAGLNVGNEIDGKHNTFERPFYILKKCNEGMSIGILCTSTFRKGIFMYVLKTFDLEFILNFSQIKTLSSKRLLRKVVSIRTTYQDDIILKFYEYINRKPTR